MPRVIILSNPRSGSTYLRELLNCHPEIYIDEELLNDEIEIQGDPLVQLEKQLSAHSQTYAGFKVFPEQIFGRGLEFSSLIHHLGVTQVIILWREGILETLASRRIAVKTGVWYTTTSTTTNTKTKSEKIQINQDDLKEYIEKTIEDWNEIANQWPVGILPIFIKFEDFIKNPIEQVRYVLSRLACSSDKFSFATPSKRQNPGRLTDKVTNYYELPTELRELKLNVQELLEPKIQSSIQLQLSPETLEFAPDREPCIPPSGWRYRVAEPFMPTILKQNVFDAVESGSLSSAGFWPRLMSSKLKQLFQVPVAQPCCNGFTSLMLALQSANIGEGDEVIMPSMTMVAVPNATYFVRAQPIFADSAKGSYNPGWKEISEMATHKTKAVILTHTYGIPTPEIEKIAQECAKRNWWLIEDISQAVGVKFKTSDGTDKLLGTFGDFACASLYVNKMIHAGDGGFVIAKDPKFGIRLTSLVNHGFTPSFHFVHFQPAINAKINGFGAAAACGCIDEIQYVMEHRSQVARMYRNTLSDLPLKLMPVCGAYDTPWVFGLQCDSKAQRTALRAFLAEKRIETRDYFFALHLQPAYYNGQKSTSLQKRLPVSEILGSTGFYLPTHSNLTEDDINYISSCVKLYFNTSNKKLQITDYPVPPPMRTSLALQVEPGTFRVGIREFNESGSLEQKEFRGHIYIEAVKLGLEAEEVIIHERWDQKSLLVSRINDCIQTANEMGFQKKKDENIMEKYFEPYVSYFNSQTSFEQPSAKPWLNIDFLAVDDNTISNKAKLIPTTTDSETLQLLIWLLKEIRAENIWEIGCWMGHATYLMAAVGKELGLRQKIFACDAYKWQDWMTRFVSPSEVMQPGQSFLQHFKQFTEDYFESIQPVEWPYDISELPIELRNQKPDLIFLDITQEDDELETIWEIIFPHLIPNQTIILFNGLSYKSIPFFTRHSTELVAIAKPNTIAKAFKFIPIEIKSKNLESAQFPSASSLATKKLNFQSDPGWSHHHKNLFCSSMALLREKFHEKTEPTLFFPAVEEKMCDEPETFMSNPWVGIAHSVPDYPELFYTPDLRRLCSKRYAKLMKNCKGLFTLTLAQANFLKQNLSTEYTFPIQPLKYPMEEILNFGYSEVPHLWEESSTNLIDLMLVGSFARDFNLFFNISVPKNIRKVLVAGDEISINAAAKAPKDITVLDRLKDLEYETALKKSVVFLPLKYDGAANTILLECIARSVPIICPRMSSCIEYLGGDDYPLLYDPEKPNLEVLLTLTNIKKSIDYLKNMDKSPLKLDRLIKSFENGAVLLSIPPSSLQSKEDSLLASNTAVLPKFTKYDVTICICSYKRTHHLDKILKSFWYNQDFKGSFQIIIWNNNESRQGIVNEICNKYIQQSNEKRSVELINSSRNYFCSVRFAMPVLMRSDCLLICDDDIIPGSNFVSFFTTAHQQHPKDVLCVRGHVFLPHQLNVDDPKSLWEEYDSLRFKNDDAPEQFIHFVHADACLIPKMALAEITSMEMPDPTFTLVDDYWMSFILNHHFGRKLRKLSVAGLTENPINRTDDSDQVGLALHTKPEVQDARFRLYIHHMLQGWPSWSSPTAENQKTSLTNNNNNDDDEMLKLKESKFNFWNKNNPQLGYNISSKITPEDVKDLCRMGIKSVRIGAVGIGIDTLDFDLCGFLTSSDPEEQLEELSKTIQLLAENDINTILTLERRLVSPDIWKLISSRFACFSNVIGYDLINEPFTQLESDCHWSEAKSTDDPEGMVTILNRYKEIIKSIREVDTVTPIIIEPTFWGRFHTLQKLPINELKRLESNLIVSFHFYEPMILTQRSKNKSRFTFPCTNIPVYDNTKDKYSEVISVDENFIRNILQDAKNWADQNGLRIFIGEFGICRDIPGADLYLKTIINCCRDLDISSYLFSFRDFNWEAMDYEFGTDMLNVQCSTAINGRQEWNCNNNELMEVILEGINSFNL